MSKKQFRFKRKEDRELYELFVRTHEIFSCTRIDKAVAYALAEGFILVHVHSKDLIELTFNLNHFEFREI